MQRTERCANVRTHYTIFARRPFNGLKLRAIIRLYDGRVNQVSAAELEGVRHLPNVPINHVFTREDETGVYQVFIIVLGYRCNSSEFSTYTLFA